MEHADLREQRQTVQGYSLFLTVNKVQEVAITVFVRPGRLLE
jgi:hypothetical protein